ncbi:MAG: L-threonylcarbamoyladenylate synthase [Myxococcota bacterium]
MKLSDTMEGIFTLLNSGIVIFPTETFYGIGCRIDAKAACERIAHAKGERGDKPFPVICGNILQVKNWFLFPSPEVEDILAEIWGAPLSVLLAVKPSKRNLISPFAHKDFYSAVRVSPLRVAQKLAGKCGAPIVATSANIHGNPPPTLFDAIDSRIMRVADVGLDGGVTKGGLPSTIIAVSGEGEKPGYLLIRDGAFPEKELLKYFRKI